MKATPQECLFKMLIPETLSPPFMNESLWGGPEENIFLPSSPGNFLNEVWESHVQMKGNAFKVGDSLHAEATPGIIW